MSGATNSPDPTADANPRTPTFVIPGGALARARRLGTQPHTPPTLR